MSQTIRPNVRGWRKLPVPVHASGHHWVGIKGINQSAADLDRTINRRAYAVTGLIVAVLVAILTNLDRLPDWWGGFTAGVLTLAILGIGALAIGACLGGGPR